MSSLNKKQIKDKLKVLNKIIEKKIENDNKKNFIENSKLFDITKEFIIKNDLVIYGGSAINSILKESDKFYGEDVLPDYDFYSNNAKEDSQKLADMYEKKGYKYIEAKEGVHTGTYKVFVDFIPVADITNITPRLMTTMRKNSIISKDNIMCASPDILRISMYLELSRPDGNISRWNKVFERLSLLNLNYPIDIKKKCPLDVAFNNDTPKIIEKKTILNDTFHFIKADKSLIMFGTTVNNIYKQIDKKKDFKTQDLFFNNPKLVTYFDIISLDIDKTLHDLIKVLKNNNTIKIHYKKHSGLGIGEIIPEHYIVNVNNFNLIGIYKSEACYSYIRYKNMNIATIDTMLSFYMAFLIANRKYYMKEKILCLCDYLIELHVRKYKNRQKIFKRFVTDCIGHQDTLPDIMRKKWVNKDTKNKKKWIYRPANDIKTVDKNIISVMKEHTV